MRIAPCRLISVGIYTLWLGVAAAQGADNVDATNTTTSAQTTAGASGATNTTTPSSSPLPEVVVTAQRLNLERSQIETLTGATTTTISSAAIAAMPGGSNVQLNQVLLQAPDVAQDSFGQIHVRGDHNDLQYRLNGIILPEGISVFSQVLDPRIISSLSLITGALPAEYGLRTAGIIDLTTKEGLLQGGGTVSLYGGSHSTFEPSAWYGGSTGNLSYFVSADMLRNDLGIESPDGSSSPLHDHSTQLHGFGYFEDILDPNNRLSLVLGVSNERFQIPNVPGLEPPLGLVVNGQSDFLSNDLNENQRELTQFAILSWQHSQGALNWQSSLSARYTSLDFEPDYTGDLLYNGIAQNASKGDTALAWQTYSAYQLNDAHTVRAGFYLQHDSSTSNTTSLVLPVDMTGAQTTDAPLTIPDNSSQTQSIESVYLQDEWKPIADFTLNYGLRFDAYHAYSSGSQLSPRINFVWLAAAGMTVHGGFSRYFTPPPFELIGGETISKFIGTTAEPTITQDSPPLAERADYYDFGVEQKLLANALTVGVDSYWRTARNLIDEGQFGAPIILTPFNYRVGRIGGVELTSNYTKDNFGTYANLAFQTAKGKQWESAQFNFTPDDFAYVSDHYIHLDHEQRVSASAGVSYLWLATRFNLDMLFGTGLRQSIVTPNDDHVPSYTVWNFGVTHAFHDGARGPLTVRFDAINLFDKMYQIRSGSGVGVFAPQWGARRGLFVGVAQDF